jgi:WD40 repeat protein
LWHRGGLHQIEWSADDNAIALSDFDSVRLWNQGQEEITSTLEGYSHIYDICSHATDSAFFFGAWSSENRIHSVYMFDRLDADIINLEFSSITEISSVSCNPTLSNLLAVGTVNGLISIIDIETREIISTIELSENSTPVEITDLEWNQTGDMLGVGLNEGNVVVYSFNQQSEN